MITSVTKTKLTYTCDYTSPQAIHCGQENTVKLAEVELAQDNQSAFLPPCAACGSIRVVTLADPRALGHTLEPHPGYDAAGGNHSEAARDLIHGQALLAALQRQNVSAVYREHGIRKTRS